MTTTGFAFTGFAVTSGVVGAGAGDADTGTAFDGFCVWWIATAPTLTVPATMTVIAAAVTLSAMLTAPWVRAGAADTWTAACCAVAVAPATTSCAGCQSLRRTPGSLNGARKMIGTRAATPRRSPLWSQARRKLFFARWISALACLGDMPRASPISSWERPSNSRSTSASRWWSGMDDKIVRISS